MKSRILILLNLLLFSTMIAASTPSAVATERASSTIAAIGAAQWSIGGILGDTIDYLLMFVVIAGLVIVQLRRTQDVAQRAFVGH